MKFRWFANFTEFTQKMEKNVFITTKNFLHELSTIVFLNTTSCSKGMIVGGPVVAKTHFGSQSTRDVIRTRIMRVIFYSSRVSVREKWSIAGKSMCRVRSTWKGAKEMEKNDNRGWVLTAGWKISSRNARKGQTISWRLPGIFVEELWLVSQISSDVSRSKWKIQTQTNSSFLSATPLYDTLIFFSQDIKSKTNQRLKNISSTN